MRITILAMLLIAIIACQLPKSGDVRLAAVASAEKIDTRVEARDITYNDPHMMGSALLASLPLMIPRPVAVPGVISLVLILGMVAHMDHVLIL